MRRLKRSKKHNLQKQIVGVIQLLSLRFVEIFIYVSKYHCRGFGFVSYDTAEQMESLLASHKDSPLVIDNHVVNIKRVFPESVRILSIFKRFKVVNT